MDGTDPVSYTHLDVYKRQTYTPYDKTFQNIKDKIVEIPYFKCYTVK